MIQTDTTLKIMEGQDWINRNKEMFQSKKMGGKFLVPQNTTQEVTKGPSKGGGLKAVEVEEDAAETAQPA